jgi:hypothetical protein
MITTADPYCVGAAAPLSTSGTMGAFAARLLESPYREAPSLVEESTMRQAVGNKLTASHFQPKFWHALGVGDLPVMIGGGVLGMILGEVLTVSPIVQWVSIGGGILVGLLISIVDLTSVRRARF